MGDALTVTTEAFISLLYNKEIYRLHRKFTTKMELA